MGGLGSSCSSK